MTLHTRRRGRRRDEGRREGDCNYLSNHKIPSTAVAQWKLRRKRGGKRELLRPSGRDIYPRWNALTTTTTTTILLLLLLFHFLIGKTTKKKRSHSSIAYTRTRWVHCCCCCVVPRRERGENVNRHGAYGPIVDDSRREIINNKEKDARLKKKKE